MNFTRASGICEKTVTSFPKCHCDRKFLQPRLLSSGGGQIFDSNCCRCSRKPARYGKCSKKRKRHCPSAYENKFGSIGPIIVPRSRLCLWSGCTSNRDYRNEPAKGDSASSYSRRFFQDLQDAKSCYTFYRSDLWNIQRI